MHTKAHDLAKVRDAISKDSLPDKVADDLERHLDTLPELVFKPVLPPVDRGFAAWSTLAASCLMGLFVFGFPNSAGVLLAAFLEDEIYSSQPNAETILPLIGTLCTGILYCSGIVIHPTIRCWPRLRKVYVWTGTLLCFTSLLAASFTTNIMMLLALEGVMFGLGAAFVYCPLIWYMSEWFVARRGLANGILFGADNAGGVLFPLIMPPLIARLGIAQTTRVYALALAVCLLPAAWVMKARTPAQSSNCATKEAKEMKKAGKSEEKTRAWLRDRRFWFFAIMNTLQGLAHFVPTTWLPTFAASLGLTPSHAALALTLANGGMTLGGLAAGWASDRASVWALALGSLVLSCAATVLLWGVASVSLAGVLACGAVYGVCAGAWSSLWSGFVRPVAADDAALATTIFSVLFLGRGFGMLVSTPVTTALQQATLDILPAGAPRLGFTVDGGQYLGVIVYASVCFAAGATLTVVGWALDRRERSKKQVGKV
ncbi:MFS general substrate transporter [Phanerochaete sordida]|uniref:MFS general substrate transporter n=1 Tax=Phanerochaete sordida TaxID=48140 RepID=A0A9P3GQ57_9APHY|nr:MFS general substrate transporter [Phanerochaete sordida]